MRKQDRLVEDERMSASIGVHQTRPCQAYTGICIYFFTLARLLSLPGPAQLSAPEVCANTLFGPLEISTHYIRSLCQNVLPISKQPPSALPANLVVRKRKSQRLSFWSSCTGGIFFFQTTIQRMCSLKTTKKLKCIHSSENAMQQQLWFRHI